MIKGEIWWANLPQDPYGSEPWTSSWKYHIEKIHYRIGKNIGC